MYIFICQIYALNTNSAIKLHGILIIILYKKILEVTCEKT